MGGKDAASQRYIFTRLAPIARALFHPDDDALLTYGDDDGQAIEPSWYVPVIPMALVSESREGGTGEGRRSGERRNGPGHTTRAAPTPARAPADGADGIGTGWSTSVPK